MTTFGSGRWHLLPLVVEAYRLDRYDNILFNLNIVFMIVVVEAYRLDRYDNFWCILPVGRICRL